MAMDGITTEIMVFRDMTMDGISMEEMGTPDMVATTDGILKEVMTTVNFNICKRKLFNYFETKDLFI
jgi:hypothetical protein